MGDTVGVRVYGANADEYEGDGREVRSFRETQIIESEGPEGAGNMKERVRVREERGSRAIQNGKNEREAKECRRTGDWENPRGM